LYGKYVEVVFRHKLREEKKFGSIEDLQENIARDIEQTRAWFSQAQNAN
jgi:riboflavin kinase/FMN adenylyltransferase